jgi:hypothetical protein
VRGRENACPPEDAGGVPGCYHFLEGISSPEDEEYEKMIEWWRGSLDPGLFDIDATNGELERIEL